MNEQPLAIVVDYLHGSTYEDRDMQHSTHSIALEEQSVGRYDVDDHKFSGDIIDELKLK